MDKELKNFIYNTEKVLRVIPEDSEYYQQIHEKKPLIPELEALFPEGETRIKIPVTLKGVDSWDTKFNELFKSFVTEHSGKFDVVTWKYTDGKNSVKLTKKIVEHYMGEYSVKNLEFLSTALGDQYKWIMDNKPSSKAENYIVLSRDPVDFYMASTSQPNTSCIRLDSSDGYWTGLMNAIADPYRLLAYLPGSGKVTYTLNSNKSWFKPFTLTADKFIGRSWAMFDGMTKENIISIFTPRFFGTGIEMGIVDGKISFTEKSNFSSKPYRAIRCYQEAPITTPTVYYDNMKVEITDNKFRNLNGRSSGSIMSLKGKSSLDSMVARTQ